MKRDSQPLACQHSGRWHLFLRVGNLINNLGTSLGHKNQYSHLGSKQQLNLQGQHRGLAGKEGLPLTPAQAPTALVPAARRTLAEPGVQETIRAST